MVLDESKRQFKRKRDDESNGEEGIEEILDDDLKSTLAAINRKIGKATSKYQKIDLSDTKHVRKVIVIDGKMKSAEKDKFVYHECLIHPALLFHSHPRTVFIMGGGAGSTAREVLRHKSLERVVMCDKDQDVVDLCRTHLTENAKAFGHQKLDLVINDAKAELKKRNDEKFDIIVGDLADPGEGGPCDQFYTKFFYEKILKPKLSEKGIFVTQAGPASIFIHRGAFTSIHNTIKQVFKYVKAYTAHVPSFADTWGWVMASDHPLLIEDGEMDKRIEERVDGELRYIHEAWFRSSVTMNKTVSESLANETHENTEDDPTFVHGQGIANQD